MFTIGGGYAMIPLIEREVVNRGWLDKQDFMDLFAMTQSLPGIFAVNISIFVGYKRVVSFVPAEPYSPPFVSYWPSLCFSIIFRTISG